jgi:hypothetical protein
VPILVACFLIVLLSQKIKEIKDEKIKLGLIEEKGIIFLLFKFGHLPWMDTPYNVALSQPYELQELTDEKTGCGPDHFN